MHSIIMISSTSSSSQFLSGIQSLSDSPPRLASRLSEFEFSCNFTNDSDSTATAIRSMSSADELFLNGQIRSTSSQDLAPLVSTENGDVASHLCDAYVVDRIKDLPLSDQSLLPAVRRTTSADWGDLSMKEEQVIVDNVKADTRTILSSNTTLSSSASSSRCSSAGKTSNRWVFLKDLLKSRDDANFWSRNISKKTANPLEDKQNPGLSMEAQKLHSKTWKKSGSADAIMPTNGVGRRRVSRSAHEIHYTAKRAEAEEMRKRTFLPYREGLIGCLGFSWKKIWCPE